MRRITPTLLICAAAISLASCTSIPSQNQLLTGIDTTQVAQGAAKTKLPTDPTCVDFYKNVNDFQKKARSSQGTKNFFTSLGLNVASVVVANQVVPAGITSQTGRIAANTAASTTARAGSQAALRELNSSDRADAKIIEVANEVGCPVNIRP